MGLLKSDAEEVAELKKRIDQLDRKMDLKLRQINASFLTLRDILVKMREEKKELEKEKSAIEERLSRLVAKHETLAQPAPGRLAQDVVDKLVKPVKAEMKENIELVRQIAREVTAPAEADEQMPMDRLYDMVMRRGKVKVSDAAKEFNVHEAQIEEWAKMLETNGLIDIHYPAFGRPELRKRT